MLPASRSAIWRQDLGIMELEKISSRKPARTKAESSGLRKPGSASARTKAKAGGQGRRKLEENASGDGMRDVILRVAAEEFAARGYDGARIEVITTKSKVSRNLIYYYFKSKENLFTSVLENAYNKMRDYLASLSFEGMSSEQAIRHLCRSVFEYWSSSRDFIGFLNSENFYKARHLKKSRKIQPNHPELMKKLEVVLREGHASGEFKANASPRDVYLAMSALIYHYLANQYTLSYLFQTDYSAPENMERYLRHTESVMLGYLRCSDR